MQSESPDLNIIGLQAKQASKKMAQATTEEKNRALGFLAKALHEQMAKILSANAQDIQEGVMANLSAEMLDRLSLQGRLEGIAQDVLKIQQLPDPVGEVIEKSVFPNGLRVEKRRTPIGVLGVIYESRPNVTIDVAALAIKTGNAAILRGGSETLNSNRVLAEMIQEALKAANLPANAIQFIDSPDRNLVKELLRMHHSVDLIIPRGGAGLHQFCRENSSIPVITGGIGICHLYVDSTADPAAAVQVIHNAKTQRPTVCNALETLLVNREIAPTFLPLVFEALNKSRVSLRVDPGAWKILKDYPNVKKANDAVDWDTEWLSLVLGVKVVKDLDEAIKHIQMHSSGHSDGILTNEKKHAERFVREVDSAAVYVNASTRFTDGGQFGLGAEVAISTQKLHARGPMGLKELTSYKWVIEGDYHVRE